MDVVIPLGDGSRWQDNELRYCLRALEANFRDLGRVFLCGQCPAWVRGVVHVPTPDRHANKDANTIEALLAACAAGVSQRFLRCSDDEVLLLPSAAGDLPPYWTDVPGGDSVWLRRLRATARRYGGRDFDSHLPKVYERDAFVRIAAASPYAEGRGLTIDTMYFGQVAAAAAPRLDGQRAAVKREMPAAEIRRLLEGKRYLNYSDAGLGEGLKQVLAELFPRPSRFEVPASDLRPPASELERRLAICGGCPDYRRGEVHVETWCARRDDQPLAARNCAAARYARWSARISRPASLVPHPSACRQWLDSAACPACGLPDPLRDAPDRQGDFAWAFRHATRDEHARAFASMLAEPLAAPADLAGDGVLIVGDGDYWPGIVLSVRLLRESGCRLPVQIWHNGRIGRELDGESGVELVNVVYFQGRHPARILRGWEFKTYAMLHSGFRRLLFLDADCYCVADPTPLFARLDAAPFCYWEDSFAADSVFWEWYCRAGNRRSVQGGQLLIDLRDFWRETALAHWLNMHSDYYYQHQFGDQDSWKVVLTATEGWGRCEKLLGVDWQWPAYIFSTGGQNYFVHRCRGKFLPHRNVDYNLALPLEAHVHELWRGLGYADVAAWRPPETEAERRQRLRAERRAALGWPAASGAPAGSQP